MRLASFLGRPMMNQLTDAWYVRLPDGRVLRARSTAAVRHHVAIGRIPRPSQVRRGPGEVWADLLGTAEFTDLALRSGSTADLKAPEPSDRHDPFHLQTVGVRGLGDELLTALDTTLVRPKLMAAAVAGGLLFLSTFGVHRLTGRFLPYADELLPMLVSGTLALVILAVVNSMLCRRTYLELSLLRSVRSREVRYGLLPILGRVLYVYLLVAGGALLGIAFLRRLPTGFDGSALGLSGDPAEVARTAALMLGLVAEVALWLVVGLAGLLAPILVVDECPAWVALGQWGRLVRERLGRLLLYEALAIALGLVATLPFALPVVLTELGRPRLAGNLFTGGTSYLLVGLAATPLVAYLPVANVFIYLNLRYDYSPRGR